MEDLVGRTALVTGGASGIGRALALTWARAGMHVVVADIELDRAEAVAAEARAERVDAVAVQCDVAQPESVATLVDRAFEHFGAVNLLCNNAGVTLNRPLLECSVQDWEWVLGVNLFGVINCSNAFVPRMRAQNDAAHII